MTAREELLIAVQGRIRGLETDIERLDAKVGELTADRARLAAELDELRAMEAHHATMGVDGGVGAV